MRLVVGEFSEDADVVAKPREETEEARGVAPRSRSIGMHATAEGHVVGGDTCAEDPRQLLTRAVRRARTRRRRGRDGELRNVKSRLIAQTVPSHQNFPLAQIGGDKLASLPMMRSTIPYLRLGACVTHSGWGRRGPTSPPGMSTWNPPTDDCERQTHRKENPIKYPIILVIACDDLSRRERPHGAQSGH